MEKIIEIEINGLIHIYTGLRNALDDLYDDIAKLKQQREYLLQCWKGSAADEFIKSLQNDIENLNSLLINYSSSCSLIKKAIDEYESCRDAAMNIIGLI